MKFAVISSGHKKGDNLTRVSYRPITVLSNCLYYQKCMKQSWTTNYLDISWRNSMIFSASLKRYSCQNLLLKAVDDRKCALDQNLITGVVFMDLSKAFDCLPHNLSITKLHPYGVHPCEKVIGMFFQNQIWSRLLDINRLRLACIKRATEEVKNAKYLSAVINRGWVMKHWKKRYVNFAMSSSITELWRGWVSLTMKSAFLPEIPLISWRGEASVLFHDFLILFA